MAAERSRRSNAGNRMTQMIEAEDEDDFYKTTYGGFEEVEEDNDYKSEESESEATDSDFSIDENDDVRSDVEDDDEPKRKKRVVTKAYKEPKREPAEKKTKVEKKEKKTPDIPSVQIYTSPERKSLRKSTALKSKQVQSRQKRREEQARILADIADKKNINVEDMRRLTQEELLAEAKITEQLNLKSLETYERLELEKKRTRVQKQVYRGPVIRYHSVTMPVLSEEPAVDLEISVDGDGDNQTEVSGPTDKKPPVTVTENCSRSFVTFTDEATFNSIFPLQKRKYPQRPVCPVTRLPAKYIDPITRTPYATLQAFRLIRDAYAKQLAQGEGSRNDESESRDSSPSPATPTAAQQRRKAQAAAAVVSAAE